MNKVVITRQLGKYAALKMIPDSICAVIVTYHPNACMIEQVSNVLAQVQGLVVVDNGSDPENLNSLRAGAQLLGFELIENRENLGIAQALNQGIHWAKAEGYQWVVLLDQDSRITECFVDHLLSSWRAHPQRERVVTIVPCYVDPSNGVEIPFHRAKEGGPLVAMTSGSLLPTWVFDRIGWFRSDFFIDYVDFEYSLRARSEGYLLARSNDAILFHSPGAPTTVRIFGISLLRTSNHNAMRRYYMTRNRIVMSRKYFRAFPLWTINDLMYIGKEALKVLIGESNRRPKIAAMFKGLVDGVAGRMGKM